MSTVADGDGPGSTMATMTATYPRRLSTSLTFLFKFVFPLCVLSVLTWVTVGAASEDVLRALPLLVVDGLVLALFWYWAWPIKRVVAYADHLLVSNYLREIPIRYEQIAGVREVTWINWRPTIVTLKTAGPFGDRVVYYPTVDALLGGFGKERSATTFLRGHLT